MKDIDTKDPPDVPGGYSPNDGGCIPMPVDYPKAPIGPFPDPAVDPIGPDPFFSVK
jgi:hypothetical protein